MTRSVSYFIQGEPRGKGRPRSAIRGKRNGEQFVSVYTDAKTRSYEKLIAQETALAIKEPFTGPVELRMVCTFSIPASWSRKAREAALGAYKLSKPDIDNLAKIADGMNGIAWADDVQIVRLLIAKKYLSSPDDAPGIAVTITEL